METKDFLGLVELSDSQKREVTGGFVPFWMPDVWMCSEEELKWYYVLDELTGLYVPRDPFMCY